MSAIDAAVSSGVWYPGRRPSRMMWLWLSTRPGTTVRPFRLITCLQRLSTRPASLPTAENLSLWTVTVETTRFCASIVWMTPLTNTVSRPFGQRSASPESANAALASIASVVASRRARRRSGSVHKVISLSPLVSAGVAAFAGHDRRRGRWRQMVDADRYDRCDRFAVRVSMELRHLRYFVALADCLSFTRAADRVHVTQSTLSHQIRQLEDEIGQRLFERIGKRVVTTEAGELFLAFAVRALKEVDLGIAMLKPGGGGLSGQVRVGATHTFNVSLIPECVALFLARHPTVRVRVDELAAEQVANGLRDGELDIGIAYRPTGPTDLRFEPLYHEEMVLVIAHGHPLARRKRIRMVELHQQRLVLLPRHFATRLLLEECFHASGAEPIIVA